MANTTDLRDGYNESRQQFVDRGRPYELEVGISDPVSIAYGLMGDDGTYPAGRMQTYYDNYSTGNWTFQSSCGQVTTYLRDSALKGNWVEMIDNVRGSSGEYTTKQQCYDWIKQNVLTETGYFGVLLGCHSFTLAIFNNKVRIYQAYMAIGFGGYNFTECINWDEEFTLTNFQKHLRKVILGGGNQGASAAALFHGTCDPSANCSNSGLVNLSVRERRGDHPNVMTIRDNFNAFKRSHDQEWTKAKYKTIKNCAMAIGAPSKVGRGAWTPDSHGECEVCAEKVKKFTRHHCRVCGKLICGKNSCRKKMKVMSSKRRHEKKVSASVCVNCFNIYN